MKDKYFALIFIILFLIQFSSATTNIAYIVKLNPDSSIVNLLNQSGYKFDVIKIDNIQSVNWNNYDIILVSNDKFGSLASNIPVNEKHAVILDTNDLDIWGWTKSSTASLTQPTQPQNIPIIDVNSSIVNGVANPFMTYVSQSNSNSGVYTIYYLTLLDKAPSVKIIVADGLIRNNQIKNGGVVLTAEPNAQLLNGKISHARSVFIGLPYTSYWTQDTKKIFLNSLKWVVEGDDRDHDGYPSSVDCNDNDPLIHPNAIEIPYNSVDENCDGYDLADVDNDGYCKAGYVIQNKTLQCSKEIGTIGTDCNDNDASIHPGAADPSRNCINDAPVQLETIPDQIWNEDENLSLNLSRYFSDADSPTLNYSIAETSPSNENMLLILKNGVATFIPPLNWNGEDWIIFGISDGTNRILSNKITLKVNPVNDAPVLGNLSDIKVIEGDLAKIFPAATDVDGDNVTFSYSQPFNSQGEWQTRLGDAGNYAVSITANDGHGGIDVKTLNVNVVKKILINEFAIFSTVNNNSWVELYNPGNNDVDLNGFSLEDSVGVKINLSGKISMNGFYVLENAGFLNRDGDLISLKLGGNIVDQIVYGDYNNLTGNLPSPLINQSTGRNPDGSDHFVVFNVPTKGLPYNADMIPPNVSLISPENKSIINSHNVNVNYTATDNSNNLACQLFLGLNSRLLQGRDRQSITNNSIGYFFLTNLANGIYIWNVQCFDGTNYNSANENRTFSVDAPNAPVLNSVENKIVNENESLNFTISAFDVDGGDLHYSADNLPSGASFVSDSGNGIGLFSWTPGIGQAGNYNVLFRVVDNSSLSDSKIVSINVLKSILPPSFSDADKCSVFDRNISVMITDPGQNKKYILNDNVDVKVKVRNNGGEGINPDVKVYLYDLTDDQVSSESNSENLDISKGKTEEADLNFNVPYDVKENHDFVIYAVSMENENSFCNSAHIPIKLEREKERINIKDFVVNPSIIRKGQSFDVKLTVQNVGTKNLKDIYVVLSNSELGINKKSENFDLERFDKGDTKKLSFNFNAMENISYGNYKLQAEVFYSDTSEKDSKDILVKELQIQQLQQTYLNENSVNNTISGENVNLVQYTGNNERNYVSIKPQENSNIVVKKPITKIGVNYNSYDYLSNDSMMSTLIVFDIILGIGIIILAIAIVYLALSYSRIRRRARRNKNVVMGKVMKFEK